MRGVLLLALLELGCAHGALMQQLELTQVKSTTSFDMDAARASSVPAGVTFMVEGGLRRVDPTTVEAVGLLVNETERPQSVTLFPVGASGFSLLPSPGLATRLPPRAGQPPWPPPAPPPPLVLELPAHSRVRFVTTLDERDWTWAEGRRTVEWVFSFWNPPQPRGTLPLD